MAELLLVSCTFEERTDDTIDFTTLMFSFPSHAAGFSVSLTI
jgi:hypothetical protein